MTGFNTACTYLTWIYTNAFVGKVSQPVAARLPGGSRFFSRLKNVRSGFVAVFETGEVCFLQSNQERNLDIKLPGIVRVGELLYICLEL